MIYWIVYVLLPVEFQSKTPYLPAHIRMSNSSGRYCLNVFLYHITRLCYGNQCILHMFWNDVINHFPVYVYVYLDALDDQTLPVVLLGGFSEHLIGLCCEKETKLVSLCFKFLSKIMTAQLRHM